MNLYYIEDSEKDFSAISNLLRKKKYTVYPTKDNWASELNIITLFLQNSNEENASNLIKLFDKYEIELFVIDVKIDLEDAGGVTLYQFINEKTILINKVVFVSSVSQINPTLPISSAGNVEFVGKGSEDVISYKQIARIIAQKIELIVGRKKTWWDKIVDFYNSLADSI